MDTMTNETREFSNSQALSNAVAVLGTLQPWVYGLLIHLVPYVVPLVLASEYYFIYNINII